MTRGQILGLPPCERDFGILLNQDLKSNKHQKKAARTAGEDYNRSNRHSTKGIEKPTFNCISSTVPVLILRPLPGHLGYKETSAVRRRYGQSQVGKEGHKLKGR